ncbi:PDZK1-interacting protein 1 [Diretmus argenteus]
MGRVYTVLSWLLTVGVVMAQTVQSDNQRLLPQWLTGIIAVAAFLFLAFVAVVVNKAWCEHSSREAAQEKDEHHVMTKGNTYDTTVDVVRRWQNITVLNNKTT